MKTLVFRLAMQVPDATEAGDAATDAATALAVLEPAYVIQPLELEV